ncbi:MAG: hypothetical protein O7H41_08755 [Planctomycetota bacterium]|nr:hypothetical protein [Planctomycetota bacterium]
MIESGSAWRIIRDGPGDPFWNMAVDEVLLRGIDPRPTLRLYQWAPPAISLGRFQRAVPPGLPEDAPCVRRCTGGGAIYHHIELTFAVAFSLELGAFERNPLIPYETIQRAIAFGLRGLGVETRPWNGPPIESEGICYEARCGSDLMHGGSKLVGMAQRRKRGRVLVHGVLPLEPHPYAPTGTTLRDALGRTVSVDEAAHGLIAGFTEGLGMKGDAAVLTDEEWRAAEERCQTARPETELLPR